MKFLSIALAALVAMAEGKKSITGKQIQTRMQKGQYNKATLMRGAKPYSAGAKKRALEAEEEQEFEINGLYSIQFNSCKSLSVADEDMLGEDYIYYAKEGQIKAEKSYIIFDVCLTEYCYYQGDEEKLTYITDVGSFFQAFADFLPNQVEQYCNGCQQNEDYCYGNLDAQQAGDDAAGDDAAAEEGGEEEAEEEQAEEGEEEGNEEENQEEEQEGEQEGEGEQEEGEGDERRKKRRNLKKLTQKTTRKTKSRKLAEVEMIDCDLCYEYECFENEDNQENQGDDVVYEFEDALEWLNGLSECQQLEDQVWNNLPVYAGLICNAYGTGVEIGVFLDEDCTMYSNQQSFANLMSESDSEYFNLSKDVVEYMFTNDFSCYNPEIQYTNPYAEEEQAQEEEEDNGEAPEAAEWCGNLFNGEAVNMYDCGGEQEDNGEEQEEDENLANYEWYSYKLTNEQAEDFAEVCQVMKGMDGDWETIYDKDNSGSLYDYKKGKNADKSTKLSPGAIAGIIILVIVAAAACTAFCCRTNKKDGKKAPLINTSGGQMT